MDLGKEVPRDSLRPWSRGTLLWTERVSRKPWNLEFRPKEVSKSFVNNSRTTHGPKLLRGLYLRVGNPSESSLGTTVSLVPLVPQDPREPPGLSHDPQSLLPGILYLWILLPASYNQFVLSSSLLGRSISPAGTFSPLPRKVFVEGLVHDLSLPASLWVLGECLLERSDRTNMDGGQKSVLKRPGG